MLDFENLSRTRGDAKMASAHLICREAFGVNKSEGKNEYTTGSWVLTEDEAASLIGGRLYLHNTKSEPSYFGGTVLEWFRSKREDAAIEEGLTFRIVSDREGKGVAWRGADHSMAWFSGVVV